jgi:general secretion pathway protein N
MTATTFRTSLAGQRTAGRWALAGCLVGGALSLLLNIPAVWVSQAVSRATQGRVLLLEAQGTLWQGSAHLVLSAGPGSSGAQALPSRLQWQLQPGWSGDWSLRLNARCCLAQAWDWRATPSLTGLKLSVSDSPFKVPAHLLTGLGTPWNTVQPEGQLTLQTRQLQLAWSERQWQFSGQLSLQLDNLSSQLTTLRPMGSYLVSLHAQPQPTVKLTTLEGRLQLSGEGRWVAQRLQFNGEAQAATPADEPVLANLLSVLGPRQGHKALLKLG